jgi:hypothetical protein
MAIQQSHFRIRTAGAEQAVNANAGGDWQGDIDTNVTMDMTDPDGGIITRIRFELEEINTTSTTIIPKLQYRIDGGTWTDCPDKSSIDSYDAPNTNTFLGGVIVADKDAVADGAATTNILSGSSRGFVAGTLEHDTVGASITLNDQHTEIEYQVLIRRFYSGVTTNNDNPRSAIADAAEVEFRIVESDDTILGGTYVIPKITVNVPDGYIGGTGIETQQNFAFMETPSGTLYAPIEDGESTANIMMLKSTDGGKSWVPVDNATAMTDNDMESWSMSYDDTNKIIHCVHVSGDVNYYQFATEDYAVGVDQDTWLTGRFSTLETAIGATNQSCECIIRGTNVYAFYPDLSTTEQIFWKKKADLTTGTWGSRTSIDTTGGTTDFSGIAAVLGPNSDKIHCFYNDLTNFTLYYVTLNTSDALGTRQTVETDMPSNNDSQHGTTNAIAWYNGTTEKAMIGYTDETNGYLFTVIVENDGTPNTRQNASNSVAVLTDPVGLNSRQPVAFLARNGNTVYTIYADDATEDIWLNSNSDGGGWGTPTEIVDGVSCHQVRGHVFRHSSGNGGSLVIGYIRDVRLNETYGVSPFAGYSGSNTYQEYSLETNIADNQPAYTEGLRIFPFTEDFSVGSNDDPWRVSHWNHNPVTDVG